jgi:hypothetical protein
VLEGHDIEGSTWYLYAFFIAARSADFASRCVDADKYEGRPLVVIDFDNVKSFPEYEELDMDGHFKPLGNFRILRESSQGKGFL